MSTPDNPDIKIEYSSDSFPPSDWVELQDYANAFRIRDAGVLKVPTANIFLHNFRGRFSDKTSSLYLSDYKFMRVRVDVGNGLDTIFYGRIYGKRDPISGAYFTGGFGSGFGSGFQVGSGGLRSTLEVICRDVGAQKLLDETKSYPDNLGYTSKGITCKVAVEDYLLNPDSGEDTGITLETDSGSILTTTFPKDPQKDTLLDLTRQVADALSYDGYCYVNGSNQLKLYFKHLANFPETDPAIDLRHPFVSIEPSYDIDEVKNIIFVWGGTDGGYPPLDLWCEQTVANFPSAWAGNNATVSDSSWEPQGGTLWNIKVVRDSIDVFSGELDISATDYKDPKNQLPYIDCSTTTEGKRFVQITFSIYVTDLEPLASTQDMRIYLYDNAGKKAYKSWTLTPLFTWGTVTYNVGSGGDFTEDSGFDWSQIQKIRIEDRTTTEGYKEFFVDLLRFVAAGWKIDPILFPVHNPKAEDTTSKALYGNKTYHYTDEKINCFEQTKSIRDFILATRKQLLKKIVVTKNGAYTFAKPQQYLRLYLPEHNIAYTEKWRIVELEHNWDRRRSHVFRTSFTLVKRPDIYDSTAIQMNELSGLLKKVTK
jgi:hypothetical protein